MKTEAEDAADRKDERELCQRLEPHFERLAAAGRLEWRKEVQMLHWRHAADDGRRIIRIDYVCRFDEGPLIGIEAKKAPARAAEIGRYIKQCADYAVSVVRGHAENLKGWTGKPLHAVFLAVEIGQCHDYIRRHHAEAVRLSSAFRVGFIRRHPRYGIQLTLSDDENWWCEAYGYRGDAFSRNSNIRTGNGSFKLPDADMAPADDTP